MAKIATDLEQSKKLAKILPLESADMEYMFLKKDGSKISNVPFVKDGFEEPECCYIFIPCWSLAALLNLLKDYTLQTNTDGTVFVVCESKKPMISDAYNNPVDACYEMIVKLHEEELI